MGKKKHKHQLDLDRKPGRNVPCSCGSGLQAKKCCWGPNTPALTVPYTPMHDMLPLTTAIELDRVFLRRWGYHPGLAERNVMLDGTEAEMQDLIVRKLAALNAHPKWLQAVKELKMLITELNVELVTEEEAAAWNAIMGDSPEVLEEPREDER